MHPDEALQNFAEIVLSYEDKLFSLNEAETRAKIIDRVLRECLGWTEECLRREDRVDSGYTDYQLLIDGIPRLVIEAKRSGEYFELPKTMNQRAYKISGVIQTVTNLVQAMQQARTYTVDVGCKYAIVFNGHQLAVFSAIVIGKSWKESYVTVFHSLDDIKKHFNLFWNILSYESVKAGSLIDIIDKGKEPITFRKVISEIHNPDQLWERNDLYTFIQPLSSLVFSELLDEDKVDMLKQCYVFEKSNRFLGEDLENYFIDNLPHFAAKYRIKDIFERANKAGVFEKEYFERQKGSARGSLIVLVGGIGSGKSTFLHRFFKIVLAPHENLLWYYIDFRSATLNPDELESFIVNSIIKQWYTKYAVKFTANLEALGFSTLPKESKEFLTKLFNLLHVLGFSITVAIDNVDQHDTVFQEKIFIVSSHLTEIFKITTIVVMREETFMTSARTGVLSAYDVPKFHIASPEFLTLIRARLNFAISLLKAKSIPYPDPVVTNLIRYFAIIRGSLGRKNEQSRKLVSFINSISVGNMRDALIMFTYFLISGNTNVEEIFRKNDESGWYQIAYHQFIKSVIMGEHQFYSQDRSHLMNIFDFDPTLTDSHFNSLRILKYLADAYNKRSPIGRGYLGLEELIYTAEIVGVRRNVIYDTLSRLAQWTLIEFDNQSKKDVAHASYVKITSAGRYYLDNLRHEFVYLDSILIDTPISDEKVITQIRSTLQNPDLDQRLRRTGLFVDYLERAESREFKDHPEYVHSELTNKQFAHETADVFRRERDEIAPQTWSTKPEPD